MAKILLIDDDTELTSLLKEVLSFEGFDVTEANDGEAGLAAINSKIDLILLDVMMPKLNGMETLKRLRENWETPVLMLTAKGEEIDRVIGLELGADDYLPKPFSVTANCWHASVRFCVVPAALKRAAKTATTLSTKKSNSTRVSKKPIATML